MTIATGHGRESFNYTALCRNPTLEGIGISHLPFATITKNTDDLRTIVPGLKNCETPTRPRDVVIDSDMSLSQAFKNLSPECPDSILGKQQLLRVFYFGVDQKLHQG